MIDLSDEQLSAALHSLGAAFTQAGAAINEIANLLSAAPQASQGDGADADQHDEDDNKIPLGKRIRDPLAPKRPNPAYRLFIKDVIAKMREDSPEASQADLFKRVSEKWKGLDQAAKDRYQAQYEENKKIYERELDDYKQYREKNPFDEEKELLNYGPVKRRRVLKTKAIKAEAPSEEPSAASNKEPAAPKKKRQPKKKQQPEQEQTEENHAKVSEAESDQEEEEGKLVPAPVTPSTSATTGTAAESSSNAREDTTKEKKKSKRNKKKGDKFAEKSADKSAGKPLKNKK